MRVDLCLIGPGDRFEWPHGDMIAAEATPASVAEAMTAQPARDASACLYWDPALGVPRIDAAWFATLRAEVIHGGLALSTAGQPAIIDYVHPTWMWNRDPDGAIEATSWRASMRACLVATEVVRQLGGLRCEFRTLEAAALELGHRYLRRGAFVRYDPRLAPRGQQGVAASLPLFDEILFARLRYGDFWTRWAIGRALVTGELPVTQLGDARAAFRVGRSPERKFVRAREPLGHSVSREARVSVVLPTIERYTYLRTLLAQLETQTHRVHEVLIVDQTTEAKREHGLVAEFPTLPIVHVFRDNPGQCSARNHALQLATGDYVLFLDDDNEIDPHLVERHLACLAMNRAEVSCGVSIEDGAGALEEHMLIERASDVFSTNNAMVKRDALRASGLFDVAYDRRQCEDADIGVRLYLAGAFAVLDPRMTVIHRHAPTGGLRVHGTRVVTRASSRTKITDRNLPNQSEAYLAMRYFTARQVREMLFLRTWGTMRVKGGWLRRGMKMAYSLAVLPDTMRVVRGAERSARVMLETFPQIEELDVNARR